MAEKKKRNREFRVLRLYPEDYKLLQDLADGRKETPDRHSALLELVEVAKWMDIPRKEERKPIRLGIPIELKEVLEARAEQSKHNVQDILLMAARTYREKYPLPQRD